jgi:hypothetical protein
MAIRLHHYVMLTKTQSSLISYPYESNFFFIYNIKPTYFSGTPTMAEQKIPEQKMPEQKIPEWKMPEACYRKCQNWKIPE